MKLFGSREVKGLPDLVDHELRIGKLESLLRQLETEQLTLHDQVRKWMRRAVAAERNQERSTLGAAPAPATPPAPPSRSTRGMWGARARIAMRALGANGAGGGFEGGPAATDGDPHLFNGHEADEGRD